MNDLDMTPFETRLASRLRAHAGIRVEPVDSATVASAAMSAPTALSVHSGLTLRGATIGPAWIGLAVVLVLTLLAAVAVTGVLDQRPRLDDRPFPAGTWSADQPATMNFGDPSGPPGTLTMVLDARVLVSSSEHGLIDWLRANSKQAGDEIVLTTSTWTPSGRGRNDGVADLSQGDAEAPLLLPPCRVGEVGRYRWAVDPTGRALTLVAVRDDCAARQFVIADRVWTR